MMYSMCSNNLSWLGLYEVLYTLQLSVLLNIYREMKIVTDELHLIFHGEVELGYCHGHLSPMVFQFSMSTI